MKNMLQKWGKTGIITLFLVTAFFSGTFTGFAKNQQVHPSHVLGVSTHITPTPTALLTPTSTPITIINNIIVPSQAPTIITQIPTPLPTSVQTTPTVIPTNTPTPTPTQEPTPTVTPSLTSNVTPTVTVTPTPTLTSTPVSQTASIVVDYAGEHVESTYSVTITSGESAWQAVQDGVGLSNLHYTDYGGSLGIFITGFNGIDASSNQYYDFQVNGTSSNVGVSSYIVQPNDKLSFVLTSY